MLIFRGGNKAASGCQFRNASADSLAKFTEMGDMNASFIILGGAETVLFLTWFGLLFGSKNIGPKRKRIGHFMLLLWCAVFVVCLVLIIIDKFM